MVRWALKPSLRAAPCCRVEVVKGGGGERRAGFFSTAATVKLAALTASLAKKAEDIVAQIELGEALALVLGQARQEQVAAGQDIGLDRSSIPGC